VRPAALAIVLVAASAVAAPASEGWLGTVSQSIRDGEYRLSRRDGAEGWTAPNREQDLRAWWHDGALEVTPRVEGDAWRFTYRLASVGRGGATRLADVAFERVDAGRLAWQRDGLVEWYANDARGIEQGFTIESRPAGEASESVLIEGFISGLLAYPTDDGTSILLRTAAGCDALRIRNLVVRDANGVEIESCLSVTAGALQISLDDRDAVCPTTA
jgi:hypothetical protein